MRDSVFALVRRSSLVWGLPLAFGLGLLLGLLGGLWTSPASQALLALVVLLGCVLRWGSWVRRVRMPRRLGRMVLGRLAILLLFLVPIVLVQVFPQTLLSCMVVGWVASLTLGLPGKGWKALLLAAALGSAAGVGLLNAYGSFLSGQTINILLAGTMLLLSLLGGVLGGSARWLADWWLGSASPIAASPSLIPPDGAAPAPPASRDGRVSRREALVGMAGAVGLAAASGLLTWATRTLSSYFVLPLVTYRGHQHFISSLCWSPDGSRIVSVGGEFTDSFQIWEAATGKTLFMAPTQPEGTTAFASWAPNGRWIAAELSPGAAIWEATDHTVLASYPDFLGAIGWSPDSTHLVSAQDGVIWEAATGRTVVTWQQRDVLVYCVAWSPDGSRIASGGGQFDQVHLGQSQAIVILWDAATGQPLMSYRGHAQDGDDPPVFVVAWSPASTQIASVSPAGVVHVWEMASGQTLLRYRGHTNVVTALAWSPDGRRLASGSRDGTVQIWNPVSGERQFTYHGHNPAGNQSGAGVTTMAWSPDGRLIASGDNHGTIQIWRPA